MPPRLRDLQEPSLSQPQSGSASQPQSGSASQPQSGSASQPHSGSASQPQEDSQQPELPIPRIRSKSSNPKVWLQRPRLRTSTPRKLVHFIEKHLLFRSIELEVSLPSQRHPIHGSACLIAYLANFNALPCSVMEKM